MFVMFRPTLLKIYNSYKNYTSEEYSLEEMQEIDALIQAGMLNADVFEDTSTFKDRYKTFRTGKGFPLSKSGLEELNKHWYLRLKEGWWVTLLVDLAAVIAFIISVILLFS